MTESTPPPTPSAGPEGSSRTTSADGTVPDATNGGRKRLPKSLRRTIRILLFLLVLHVFVVPQIAGTRKALHLVAHVNPLLLLAALVTETASLIASAWIITTLLPQQHRVGLGTVLRIALSSLAVTHVVPGGTAASTVVQIRLLKDQGVPADESGFAVATAGIGSAVVLNVILWLALLVTIPASGFQPVFATAAAVGVVLLGTFAGLVVSLIRGREGSVRVARRIAGPLPLVSPDGAERAIRRIAGELTVLSKDRDRLKRAVLGATLNWLLDATTLYLMVAAFGTWASVNGVLVAYGLANVLAAIPLSPGGLGVVEVTLTSILVLFDVPRGVALLGVTSYRLLNFWAPIPVGAGSYLSLRLTTLRDRHRFADELEEVVMTAGRSRRVTGHDHAEPPAGEEPLEKHPHDGQLPGDVGVQAERQEPI